MKLNLFLLAKTKLVGLLLILFMGAACTPTPKDVVNAFGKTIASKDFERCQKYMTKEYAAEVFSYDNILDHYKSGVNVTNIELKKVIVLETNAFAVLLVGAKHGYLDSRINGIYLELELSKSMGNWRIHDIGVKMPYYGEALDISTEFPDDFFNTENKTIKKTIYSINDKLTNFILGINNYYDAW